MPFGEDGMLMTKIKKEKGRTDSRIRIFIDELDDSLVRNLIMKKNGKSTYLSLKFRE